jgi:hypothetical protein
MAHARDERSPLRTDVLDLMEARIVRLSDPQDELEA